MSDIDPELLRAVLDAIIPPDQDPGATDLGVDSFVLHILARDRADAAAVIRAGLAQLGAGFLALTPIQRTAKLTALADQPWFTTLAELAAEGYYADPGNGGNRDARSWAMLGYEPRLPKSSPGEGRR